MENKKFDLVTVIVNNGYTDLVMNAAKAAGARGGTIIHARGTGNAQLEEFFGIIIQPEKEIVLILVLKKIKDRVLKSIYDAAGLETKGQGIAFTLPVDDVVGIFDDIENENS